MNNEIFKVDNVISEYTPIMRGDEVIGCTIGENKRGYPIKCVLYSHFLSEQDIMGSNDTRHVCYLELNCPPNKESENDEKVWTAADLRRYEME